MEYSIFKFGDIFSLKLPSNWAEYDDGDDLAAFFNTEKWSGNLRITPITVKPSKIAELMKAQLTNKPNAITDELGKWQMVFYSSVSDDGENLIYYWIVGEKRTLLMCSFTVDVSTCASEESHKELAVVKTILSSLKIEY
jgi:hypothetical protein